MFFSFEPILLDRRDSSSSSTANYSKAYSLSPTQVWDGNDGAWSTFFIRVGTPAQYFRILPSTIGAETWVPLGVNCSKSGYCGNARGVEPTNSGSSGIYAGTPSGQALTSVDAGSTCTLDKSPMCIDCNSVNGKCTNGPCTGRLCCGDPAGQCNSGGCNGVSSLCTNMYIGCPCLGPDWNSNGIVGGASATATAPNPGLSLGFLSNSSTSWVNLGTHTSSSQNLLAGTSQGQYGFDTVGLGPDVNMGLTISNSIVAGQPTEPFFLGTLGLAPTNTSGPSSNATSFMQALINKKMIPSLSYGYTAGALYRSTPSLGSLTLGGYDKNRFVANSVTFPVSSTSLRVNVQSISVAGALNSQNSLLPQPLSALIDTTSPHTYLPQNICQNFVDAFGLVWDDSTQYYLVNDSIHQTLINNNPTVTFSLTGQGNNAVNITLPYAAFDLQAAVPIYSNGTNYFPLRPSANSNQNLLGRAFFQEAYLFVDYEAKYFSVSQTTYPYPNTTDLVTINHNGSAGSGSGSGGKLSGGAIAGAVIGSVAGAALLIAAAFFLFRKWHNKRHPTRKTRNISSPIKTEKGPSMSSYAGSMGAAGLLEKNGQGMHWPGANSPSPSSAHSPNHGGAYGPHGGFASNSPTAIDPNSPRGMHGEQYGELEDPTAPAVALARQHQQQQFMKFAHGGQAPPMYTTYPSQGANTILPSSFFTAAAANAAAANGTLHSSPSSASEKPLPRPPQELPGDDPVGELMQKRDSDATAAMGGVNARTLRNGGRHSSATGGAGETDSPIVPGMAIAPPPRSSSRSGSASRSPGGLGRGMSRKNSDRSEGSLGRNGSGSGSGGLSPVSGGSGSEGGGVSREGSMAGTGTKERVRHIYEMMG